MDPLRDWLRSSLGVEVEELAGGRASGELPVSAAIVNRLAAAQLGASRGPIAAVRIEPLDQNVIEIHLTPSARLIPSIRVRATIVRQPRLPDDPVLALRWTLPMAPALARLAAPFVSNLGSLPRGVRIDGETVLVDLRQLLAERGMVELLRYVRAIRVSTRPGAFVVNFEGEI